MRAVVCRELGPPSSLRVTDEPEPGPPGPGKVTVRVEAAGVNYVDALFVQGRYQIKPPLPFVPGSEAAGTIAAVGDGVEGLAVGDRVLASFGLGAFAEQLVLDALAVTRLPDALDAPRAATFTQSYATALFSLRDRADLQPGETALVLGAGGGVGLATIDVARALGAKVIGAASSEDKRAAAADAGAAATIDTTGEPLKDRARELARSLAQEGRDRLVSGVDVVVDPIGGPLADAALRALGEGGRYLVIGFASGEIPSLPLNQVLLRNRSLVGVDWGAWALGHPDRQRQLLDELLTWVDAGRLHPPAPVTYPLDQAGQALDDLLERRVVGKLALVP
jgi:NADPH2:quinone reductase